MKGQPLLLESSFSFSFKTIQATAVLLLSTFDSGKNLETKRQVCFSFLSNLILIILGYFGKKMPFSLKIMITLILLKVGFCKNI